MRVIMPSSGPDRRLAGDSGSEAAGSAQLALKSPRSETHAEVVARERRSPFLRESGGHPAEGKNWAAAMRRSGSPWWWSECGERAAQATLLIRIGTRERTSEPQMDLARHACAIGSRRRRKCGRSSSCTHTCGCCAQATNPVLQVGSSAHRSSPLKHASAAPRGLPSPSSSAHSRWPPRNRSR